MLAQVWLLLTGFLPPSLALNLLSALAGAVVVGGIPVLLERWGEHREGVHGAAAVLLVAHPLWWAAAVAESYTLSFALVVAGGLLLDRRRRGEATLLAGVCWGLALATHAFAAALVLPLAVALGGHLWPALLAGLTVGSAPLWLGVLGAPMDPLTGYAASPWGSWAWHAAAFLHPAKLGRGAALVVLAVLFALGPVGLAGMVRRVREGGVSRHPHPPLAAALLLLLAAVLALYSPYRIHLMAGFLVVGGVLLIPPLLSARGCAVHVLLQVGLYGGAALATGWLGQGTLGVRELPGRNNAHYFLWPPKSGETSAARYARQLLAAVPAQAVVLADFNPGAVLRLAQEVEGLRPDVTVLPTAVDDALATPSPADTLLAYLVRYSGEGRPVVLADSWAPYYRVAELRARGVSLHPCGPGWEVQVPRFPP